LQLGQEDQDQKWAWFQSLIRRPTKKSDIETEAAANLSDKTKTPSGIGISVEESNTRQRNKWTMKHSFLTAMGGFCIKKDAADSDIWQAALKGF
jgi:hypothetical protein